MTEYPDDFDQRRQQLQLVREARIAFGLAAARRMWRLVGLPDLEAEPEQLRGESGKDAFGPWGFRRWLEERADMSDSEARTPTTTLLADFQRWEALPLSLRNAMTATMFGRLLNDHGFSSFKDVRGCKVRRGIALRP